MGQQSCASLLACTRDWRIGGAQHAIQHTERHPGHCSCFLLFRGGSCPKRRFVLTICSSLFRACKCSLSIRDFVACFAISSWPKWDAVSRKFPPVLPISANAVGLQHSLQLSGVPLALHAAESFLDTCQHSPPPCNTQLPPGGLHTGAVVAHLAGPLA